MNILLVGVGGQGIILTSKILAAGLLSRGYDVKMSEIHGMSQRGGTVTTQLKYGERVYAPNIGEGEADFIVAFEKMEALRALPYLKKGGRVFTDTREIYPMPVLTGAAQYPHDATESLMASGAEVITVPATEIAQSLGNVRVQNIVLLGALTRCLNIEGVDWRELITQNVPPRAVEMNLKGFDAGRK